MYTIEELSKIENVVVKFKDIQKENAEHPAKCFFISEELMKAQERLESYKLEQNILEAKIQDIIESKNKDKKMTVSSLASAVSRDENVIDGRNRLLSLEKEVAKLKSLFKIYTTERTRSINNSISIIELIKEV